MQLFDFIAETLLQPGVSDIHLTTNNAPWVRQDGLLLAIRDPAWVDDSSMRVLLERLGIVDPNAALAAVEKQETALLREEVRSGLDFGAEVQGVRLRCNLALANGGLLSLVMRKLSDHIPSLVTLGLPDTIARQVDKPTGLVLVTGPTGSGKSTTLAGILDYLNEKVAGHILTIEDPVEYLLPQRRCKVTRKEIHKDAPSFLGALRAAMRQDPDIIMIGEIRDRETMRAAMSAAETGHLVLGTLHTTSAAKTVDRVLSFFPADDKEWARGAFATVLNCIVAQTLVPRVGGGRALAYEILVNTPDIRTTIAEGRFVQIPNQMEQGREHGQVLMHRVLVDLVKRGVVTKDAAMTASYDPVRLTKELQ